MMKIFISLFAVHFSLCSETEVQFSCITCMLIKLKENEKIYARVEMKTMMN